MCPSNQSLLNPHILIWAEPGQVVSGINPSKLSGENLINTNNMFVNKNGAILDYVETEPKNNLGLMSSDHPADVSRDLVNTLTILTVMH